VVLGLKKVLNFDAPDAVRTLYVLLATCMMNITLNLPLHMRLNLMRIRFALRSHEANAK
jgi:hypothetical protein